MIAIRLWMFMILVLLAAHPLGRLTQAQAQDVTPPHYFGIHVVDDQTERGVPLVELETVNHVRFVSDSAGWIALHEPAWMGEPIFFEVKSHGYEFPKDGFGFAGLVLTPQPGQEAVIRVRRTNIAQRLYRITGEGIYRDSLLLGKPVPLVEPLGTGKVAGQDSAMATLYGDRIYWFWGDTSRMRHPLGQFWMSGATSSLPEVDGVDPDQGIHLEYFVGEDGFSRPMARLGVETGLIWIDAICVLPDSEGRSRLVCHYAHMKSLEEMLDHGLALWNDQTQQFEPLQQLPMDQLWRFPGQAHPVRHREGTTEYIYLGEVFPTVRFPATLADLQNPDTWEAWTCLQPGSDATDPQFARDAEGRVEFNWRRNAQPVDIAMQWEWISRNKLRPEEASGVPLDVDTGKPVRVHRGTVAWNAYRQRWIMIAGEQGGTSMLGEVWYAEAPTLTGPWRRAKKIVTHDQYSFYNPVHHAFFDQAGGRRIYFEGTYTTSFSGNPTATPRYDYNQVMYRLDLDDPQLKNVQD
ncbi:MAG: hypothetical protein ACYC4U_04360 [Pirellulaceae bacterium]